jgi:general secretion pathway protein L
VTVLEASQPWNLFGYDVRGMVHYFRAGWRDFLWGDSSVVLGVIDEVVSARDASGAVRYFRAGSQVATPESPDDVIAQAVVLPDELVLCKALRVPAAAESDLESMIALEVMSSSPFPRDDTCYGWLVTERGSTELLLQLVISSKSAVMGFVASQTGSHDVVSHEVWAQAGDRMVMVSGFGEAPRLRRNRRRLGRMAAMLAYSLFAVMLLAAFGAGAKYLELQKVQAIQNKVELSAGDAVALRTSLASAKTRIETINQMLAEHPSPHRELKRLSALLDDDTWLGMAEIQGSAIKIEGQSDDASAVMQQLLRQSAYARVEAPVAIRKVGPGSEQFVLKISLANAGEGQ